MSDNYAEYKRQVEASLATIAEQYGREFTHRTKFIRDPALRAEVAAEINTAYERDTACIRQSYANILACMLPPPIIHKREIPE